FGNRERSSSFAASIDLQFNIFDGFRTSARIQEARAEFNRIQHHMERVKQAVRIEVQQAESRINEARQRIQAQQKSVRQAEKAYQIAEVRYNNGVGTQLELFDARVSLNRIKTNYLQAVYDYNIALFEWQKAVGLIQENAE
nr:TolC family protein [candidate division KSB1 bacterium]NIR65324.1 TolC family protein [candidate division Zixibacteria bacterium]NIT58644.1 TolC family protein [Fodinibius sp.]NIW46379.1 TolC family protein [Gammaproteobacteria bacterium]NIS47039.1 TolC family protein [candidate division Zixibacteria bacterium]